MEHMVPEKTKLRCFHFFALFPWLKVGMQLISKVNFKQR